MKKEQLDVVTSLVKKIDKELGKFTSTFSDYVFKKQHITFNDGEKEYMYFSPYEDMLASIAEVIHRSFHLLFDFTDANITYEEYKNKIGNRYAEFKSLQEGKYFELPDDYLSVLASDWWFFLEPYSSIVNVDPRKSSDIDFNRKILKRLLTETNFLCHLSNIIPTKETDVYNAVKKYIHIIFPESESISGQSYPTKNKVYKPDIVIPECRAAVEYKYIDKEDKINTTISQISDDVKGYKKFLDTKYFYAVFYFKEPYVAKDRFEEIWKEKGYPRNWKMIYVVGK